MAAPPVPPRPYSAQGHSQQYSSPPPVPPVPPELRYDSPPHFSDPIAAPRPHRVDPSVPANMARNLEEYPGVNYAPGFTVPQHPARGPSPLPPPQGANWSPWVGNAGISNLQSPPLSNSPPQLPSFSSNGPPQIAPLPFSSPDPAPQRTSPPAAASLTAPTPTVATLQPAVPNIHNPTFDPALKIAWARDVLALVDRTLNTSPSTDPPVGPAIINDPALLRLAQLAVSTILQFAASSAQPVPPHVAEAIYLRATLTASGAYPEYIQPNPRVAFRDFETAARAGYAQAWFRLGRDYENFNDVTHARECFERGVKLGVESCAYRMGMAHLLGQLGLQSDPSIALPLLHRAATLATVATPQPAYIFALLLLGEFNSLPAPLPSSAFAPFVPPGSTPTLEVRKHLERAAYLGFAPAQYKLGHCYEFARPPFPFDPLLSVQYYSLASQQGEVEADMALSKWFLCGSGGGEGDDSGFEKDEALAFSFAEKAAGKGLPSAEFAMGYYAEVGVGCPKDLQTAIRWYRLAQEHGNKDASERLAALSQPSPNALSRQQHDNITENKLVRKRTQAKQRSDSLGYTARYSQQLPAQSPYPQHGPQPVQQPGYPQANQYPNAPFPGQPGPPQVGRPDGRKLVENIRRSSEMGYPVAQPAPAPQLTPAQQYQQQYQQQQSRPQQMQHSAPPQQQPMQHQGGRHTVHSQTQPQPRPGSSPQMGRRPQSSGGPGGRGGPPHLATNRYTLSDAPVPYQGDRKSPGPPSGRKSPARPGLGRGAGGGRVPSMGYGGPVPGPGPVMDISPDNHVEEEDDEPPTPPGVTVGLGGAQVHAPKPSKGPTTFAEMGFQGAKAEDKDCVIM